MDKTRKEIEKEYDDFFHLFKTNGYRRLCEELSSQLERLDNVSDVKDLDDLRIRQGQIYILKQIVNFEAFTEASYKDWLTQTDE